MIVYIKLTNGEIMTEVDFVSNDEILLILKYEQYYLAYSHKNCALCSRIMMQARGCGLLVGGSRPSCINMENWIHLKQKKEKEKIFQGLFTILEQPDSETNLQSFVFD